MPPELDMSNFLVEAVNPTFDPNRVLLFASSSSMKKRTRYVSVGFYPARNYQHLVEFVGSKIKFIILDPQHVEKMAASLPKIF